MPLRPVLPLLVAATLACAACQRDPVPAPGGATAAPATADTAVAAPAPAPGRDDAGGPVDATIASQAPAAEAITAQSRGFDSKAFAGRFACLDCAGGEQVLVLDQDGGFALEDEGSGEPLRGTWTVEAEGQRLRLDPDSKQESDREYLVVSQDRLEPAPGPGTVAGPPLQRAR